MTVMALTFGPMEGAMRGQSHLKFSFTNDVKKEIGKEFSQILLVLIVMIFILSPSVAQADVVYTFIKMTCSPDNQSVTIKAFYELNNSGKIKSESSEKGTYYLNDIGSSEPQEYGKEIVCDLGGGKAVAFAAHVGDVPKHDGLQLYFKEGEHKHPFGSYSLGYGSLTLLIKASDQDKYLLTYCPDDVFQLENLEAEQQRKLAEQHKTKCEAVHIQDGVTTGSESIVDPPSE